MLLVNPKMLADLMTQDQTDQQVNIAGKLYR